MRLLHVPGVHRPRTDTWLLAGAMGSIDIRGRCVADLCTGSGALAIAATREGASEVLAVDVSRRAVFATRLNARLNGSAVRIRRGDMFGALAGASFDVIVCNPPYVPAATDALPLHRASTPLDGGRDGRALVDRVCREAPGHLRARGSLLLVHSSVCGVRETCERLRAKGLETRVLARVRGGLGPVLRARAQMLRSRGLLGETDEEELVVIHGRAPG